MQRLGNGAGICELEQQQATGKTRNSVQEIAGSIVAVKWR